MKTKIKKIVLPMVVALVAVAGAFASNLSNKKDSAVLADRLGYTITCQPTNVMCTDQGGPICTDVNGSILFDWNGTNCPIPLHKKP